MNNIANVLTHTFSQKEYIVIMIVFYLLNLLWNSFLIVHCSFEYCIPASKKPFLYHLCQYISKEMIKYFTRYGVLKNIAIFAFYKAFLGLNLSDRYVLISGLLMTLVRFIPGGFTITNQILKHFHIINLPVWVFIILIIIDIKNFKYTAGCLVELFKAHKYHQHFIVADTSLEKSIEKGRKSGEKIGNKIFKK